MKLKRERGEAVEENGRVSVVGHTEQTLHKIAVSALQPPLLPPFPPLKEILTFPEIRNLPEGRGLILWTCHVPQLRCRILVKQISFVAFIMKLYTGKCILSLSIIIVGRKKFERILRSFLSIRSISLSYSISRFEVYFISGMDL